MDTEAKKYIFLVSLLAFIVAARYKEKQIETLLSFMSILESELALILLLRRISKTQNSTIQDTFIIS